MLRYWTCLLITLMLTLPTFADEDKKLSVALGLQVIEAAGVAKCRTKAEHGRDARVDQGGQILWLVPGDDVL